MTALIFVLSLVAGFASATAWMSERRYRDMKAEFTAYKDQTAAERLAAQYAVRSAFGEFPQEPSLNEVWDPGGRGFIVLDPGLEPTDTSNL